MRGNEEWLPCRKQVRGDDESVDFRNERRGRRGGAATPDYASARQARSVRAGHRMHAASVQRPMVSGPGPFALAARFWLRMDQPLDMNWFRPIPRSRYICPAPRTRP